MEDNNLYALFAKCVTAVVLAFFLAVSSCEVAKEHIRITGMSKAIQAGVNPIAVKCALKKYVEEAEKPTCARFAP